MISRGVFDSRRKNHQIVAPVMSRMATTARNAQQLRLQLKRDVADFIQKQRAFVRQRESPDALRDRAGERALLVTEQFAFEQPRRYGRAIDFDQRAFVAPAQGMDRAGDQFLARARLTADQNGGIGWRHSFDLFENAFEQLACADQLLEAVFGTDFVFEVEFFAGELVLERVYFAVSQRIFNRDGDLPGDL